MLADVSTRCCDVATVNGSQPENIELKTGGSTLCIGKLEYFTMAPNARNSYLCNH